jgi:predicted GNAT superfamily acetyltransferase
MTSAPSSADAAALASEACAKAGIDVRVIDRIEVMREAAETLATIWGTAPGVYPVGADVMRALQHSNAYVAGVYAEDVMVGVSIAWLAGLDEPALHSHITGLVEGHRNKGEGYAVKLHQRAWALEHGIDTIYWTFDPLQRRNCFFNVTKLGARVTKYYEDFYGEMRDSINRGDRSDRLLAKWELSSPRTVRALLDKPRAGEELEASGDGVQIMVGVDALGAPRLVNESGSHVFIPADFPALRAADPEQGLAWRLAVRDAFARQYAAGRELTTVTATGWYVFEEALA